MKDVVLFVVCILEFAVCIAALIVAIRSFDKDCIEAITKILESKDDND